MKPRVVVVLPEVAHAKWLAPLRQALPEADIAARDAARAVADRNAPQADYALLWRPDPSFFEEQQQLKAVFNLGAGIDALAAMPNFPRHVPLVRLEDAGMAGPMAQYALAAALRYAFRFDEYAERQAARAWVPRYPRLPPTVDVGVLGLGAIGQVIARTLAAQGFRVRGYARAQRTVDGVDCYAGAAELPAFLAGLHVLVNALPLTPGTRGILCRPNLERLAEGAHVVNIARGAHLVESDLLELLDGGRLAHATLDVFETEPLPADHPFWSHPRITVTPHVSGVTVLEDSVRQVADKIRRMERGEPVSGVVDWTRGY